MFYIFFTCTLNCHYTNIKGASIILLPALPPPPPPPPHTHTHFSDSFNPSNLFSHGQCRSHPEPGGWCNCARWKVTPSPHPPSHTSSTINSLPHPTPLVNMVLNIHRNHLAYQGWGKGGLGGGVKGYGGGERGRLYLLLHCHHQNAPALRWSVMRAVLTCH